MKREKASADCIETQHMPKWRRARSSMNRRYSYRKELWHILKVLHRSILGNIYFLSRPFKREREQRSTHKRFWQHANLPPFIQGYIQEEGATFGIMNSVSLDSGLSDLQNSGVFNSIARSISATELRNDGKVIISNLPEEIFQLVRQDVVAAWELHDARHLREKDYLTKVMQRHLLGVSIDEEKTPENLLGTISTPKKYLASQIEPYQPGRNGTTAKYREFNLIYTEPKMAVERMLLGYIKRVLSGESYPIDETEKLELLELRKVEDCNILVHIRDLSIMLKDVWALFHPGGYQLSKAERCEVQEEFAAFMVKNGRTSLNLARHARVADSLELPLNGRDQNAVVAKAYLSIRFRLFYKWFVKTCKKIVALKQSREASLLLRRAEETYVNDRDSSTGSSDWLEVQRRSKQLQSAMRDLETHNGLKTTINYSSQYGMSLRRTIDTSHSRIADGGIFDVAQKAAAVGVGVFSPVMDDMFEGGIGIVETPNGSFYEQQRKQELERRHPMFAALQRAEGADVILTDLIEALDGAAQDIAMALDSPSVDNFQ